MKEEDYLSRCTRCAGNRYICYKKGDYAQARVCDCTGLCSECGGEGYVSEVNEQGYAMASPCDCQSLQKRLGYYNQARIPSLFYDKTIRNYLPKGESQEKVQLALYNFIKGFELGAKGLTLMGPAGTGKTHLLCATLREITLEHGIGGRFIDFFHLLSEIKRGFSEHRSDEETLAPLINIDVLAVDELGKGKNTEWELLILDQIVSRRYNAGRTTLFTTNFTVDGQAPNEAGVVPQSGRMALQGTLADHVGERVYSRLCDMCQFYLVEGQDYRRRSSSPDRAGG